jgi:hypothetical protein
MNAVEDVPVIFTLSFAPPSSKMTSARMELLDGIISAEQDLLRVRSGQRPWPDAAARIRLR